MKRFFPIVIIISATIIFLAFAAVGAFAATQPDVENVRRMLTAPDNQDLSVFDQDALVDVLVQIIENDPEEAEYHDRVVTCALKALGSMHAPQAVDLLVANLDKYPTTCLYWLGTYADVRAVDAMTSRLEDEDPSVRYEAASALASIPFDESCTGDSWRDVLYAAYTKLVETKQLEEDEDVSEALSSAIDNLLLGISNLDSSGD